MTDSTLDSPNNKVILNQAVLSALELLQDLPEQGATENQWLDHKWNRERQESYFYSTKSIKNDAYSRPA